MPRRSKPRAPSVDLLCCPACRGALSASRDVLRCKRCGPYPVLGGIPILVTGPEAWCAAYRSEALAALAEHDLVTPGAVATLDAFADAAPATEAQSFGDDWTRSELRREAEPSWPEGALARHLSALAQEPSAREWLVEHLPPSGVVVEVGCGAGVLTERLATPRRAVLCVDRSLRAVLTTLAHSARAQGVVGEAERLPVRRADVVVAENVIDLLDEPAELLETARHLASKLLISTPEAGLLEPLVAHSGWRVTDAVDGLPWLRRNSSRFTEVYAIAAYALTRTRDA